MKIFESPPLRLLTFLINLAVVFLGSSSVFALECTSADITLTSQAEVDAFQGNFGGGGTCDTVTGDLFIENGASIENLNGLSDLIHVGGYLKINQTALYNLDGLSNLTSSGSFFVGRNPSLADLDGLSALISPGSVFVYNNASLTNVNGLSSVSGVVQLISIAINPLLTDLNGLANITSVDGPLEIGKNASLKNIDALTNITSVGSNWAYIGLVIYENPLLDNLNGLANLATVSGNVSINGNSALTDLNGLSALIGVGQNVRIFDNPSLANCTGLAALLDGTDDGEPGPGPGIAGIPDVAADVTIEGNNVGCNSVEDILRFEWFDDRSEFSSTVDPLTTVGFDAVPEGTSAPFFEGDVTFHSGIVRNEAVGLPHSYWLPSASPPNYIDTVAITDTTPEDESGFLPAVFAVDVNAFGFLYNCFGCDADPNDSEIFLHFYDRAGGLITSTSTLFDLSWGEKFFGVKTTFPFAEVRFATRNIDSGGGGNWFLDDFQYAKSPENPDEIVYVSLGDSFSSGEGAGLYKKDLNGDGDTDDPGEEDTDDPSQNMCHRSQIVWSSKFPGLAPSLIAGPYDAARYNFSCSGAVMNQLDGYSEQLYKESRQFEHPELLDADVVTLSIGGNDVGFGEILEACIKDWFGNCNQDNSIFDEDNNLSLKEAVEANMLDLSARLPGKLDQLTQKAVSAEIYLFNYPDIFGTEDDCELYSVEERAWFRQLTDELSQRLECLAHDKSINFVDARPFFAGFGLCDVKTADNLYASFFKPVNRLSLVDSLFSKSKLQEQAHPNVAGQQAYAMAFKAALDGEMPAPQCAPLAQETVAQQLIEYSGFDFGDLTVSSTTESCSEALQPQQSVNVQGLGFAPSAEVSLRIYSQDFVHLFGYFNADADGKLDIEVDLPADIPVSDLALIKAMGDSDGNRRRYLLTKVYITGVGESDSDQDGVLDRCDNCPNTSNAEQIDGDEDGIGDSCDACSEDYENDIDGDGLCYSVDVCPFDVDNDSDGDGLCASLPNNDDCINNSNLDCAFDSGFEP